MQVKIRIIALTALLGAIQFITLIDSTPSVAEDFRSPRVQALGGAGHAAPLLNDALYQNPSFSSFLPEYSISGNMDWYNFNNNAYSGRLWNASIQDGRSDVFQAGVGYTRFEQGSLAHIGASKALSKQLGFGLGSKIYFPVGTGDRIADMTFSTEFIAKKWLQASFIADNLVQTADAKANNFYREFTIGTKFSIMDLLYFYFDPHLAPDAPSTNGSHFGHESAAELQLFEDLYLRGGFYKNSKIPSLNNRGDGYGLGFGWMGPRISLDYANSHVTGPITDTENTIGATIYF
jgi:hypothetical protein